MCRKINLKTCAYLSGLLLFWVCVLKVNLDEWKTRQRACVCVSRYMYERTFIGVKNHLQPPSFLSKKIRFQHCWLANASVWVTFYSVLKRGEWFFIVWTNFYQPESGPRVKNRFLDVFHCWFKELLAPKIIYKLFVFVKKLGYWSTS